MKKGLVIAIAMAAALAMAPKAEAALISGSVSFSGAASPTPGGTNWGNATGVAFTSASVESSPAPAGAYAGSQGTAVSFTNFTFNPFPGTGVVPLWTFNYGGNTFKFDLTSLSSVTQSGNNTASSIVIVGTGTLFGTGTTNYTPTAGVFVFTAQGVLGTFSFSASNGAAPIPEPGSMVLLGTGLLGLAAIARRRLRKS